MGWADEYVAADDVVFFVTDFAPWRGVACVDGRGFDAADADAVGGFAAVYAEDLLFVVAVARDDVADFPEAGRKAYGMD